MAIRSLQHMTPEPAAISGWLLSSEPAIFWPWERVSRTESRIDLRRLYFQSFN